MASSSRLRSSSNGVIVQQKALSGRFVTMSRTPHRRDQLTGCGVLDVYTIAPDGYARHPYVLDADALRRQAVCTSREVIATFELCRRHGVHVEGHEVGDEPLLNEA